MTGLVAGVVLAAGIAVVSYRLRWLTSGGSIGQFILGSMLFGLGGWPWAVPIIVFFVSSSLLSISFRDRRGTAEQYFAKSSRRDVGQVAANGGSAGVLLLVFVFTGSPFAYVSYVASCAAACADTWATEVGTLFPREPRMIIGFSRVERGRSGAVSIPGTVAALAGTLVVAASALPWILGPRRSILFAVISLAGFVGCLVDSVLGAEIQGQWRCGKCGKIIEKPMHCGVTSVHVSGLVFVSNDLVNLASIAVSALLAWGATRAISTLP